MTPSSLVRAHDGQGVRLVQAPVAAHPRGHRGRDCSASTRTRSRSATAVEGPAFGRPSSSRQPRDERGDAIGETPRRPRTTSTMSSSSVPEGGLHPEDPRFVASRNGDSGSASSCTTIRRLAPHDPRDLVRRAVLVQHAEPVLATPQFGQAGAAAAGQRVGKPGERVGNTA